MVDGIDMEQRAIALPARTRAILEAKLREQATLQALLQQQGQAIQELIEAAREMLGVPDGYDLANTGVGFVAPADNNALSVDGSESPVVSG